MAVWMCSGQGAQKPGMGESLLIVPEVANVFECASDVFGFDVASMIRTASAEKINEAILAQVATVALSVGTGMAMKARGFEPTALIGSSLGQISTLALSESLSVEETFKLLQVRATAMEAACKEQEGAMCALLAASEADALEICAECAEGDVLVIANYNCPGQVVVSGNREAVLRAQAAWKARKKPCALLKTAGAFHSPLMATAAAKLQVYCESVTFAEPHSPIVCNTDAAPFKAAEAATRLANHLVSPVKFEQGMAALLASGEREFIEVGFGGVLFTMMKRIDKAAQRLQVSTLEELNALGK